MRLNLRDRSRTVLILPAILLMALPLRAQDTEIPRTRTFSGLVAPSFPYAKPEEVHLSRKKLDWLGDEIVSWIANGELVGAELLIIKDEKAVFHEAYGWSDREEGIPVQRNSIWSIKAMSEPFTATAILMLAEQGALSLDDRVSRYLPGFAGDERTTIANLLVHTSGFSGDSVVGGDFDDFASLAGFVSLRQWVKDWATVGPTKAFGEFSYSAFNYAALGYIVEEVSDLPIDEFVEERIIEPLEIEDTSTGFSSDPAWRARLNPWYRWNERAEKYDMRWAANRPGWSFYPGAWGMLATAMDYARFMWTWMRKGAWGEVRLLSEATVEEALKTHARMDEVYGRARGWYVQQPAGTDGPPLCFNRWGGDGTQANAFPADNAIVIYFTHSRWGHHRDSFWNRLGMSGLFQHYPGPDMVSADGQQLMEVPLRPAERARYVGTYAAVDQAEDAFESLRVWEEDGVLNFRTGPTGVTADHRFHLVPLGGDRFAWGRYADGRLQGVDPLFALRFVVDDGRATAVNVMEGEQVQVFARRNE